MNTNHHISDKAELEKLIGRYFDGETTVQEEHQLRQCLADCRWNSELIDEARFAMGFFAIDAQERSRGRNRRSHHITGIAASIALLIGVGAFALWHQHVRDNMCVAYVDGSVVNDDDEVMALIRQDLNTMGEASQGMSEQLMSLGAALELDNE